MIAVLPTDGASSLERDRIESEGPMVPGANVLKEGFLTPIPSVPEDVNAVRQQGKIYFQALCPRNDFHAWLVEDTALCTLRLDRVSRIERRERDRIALRAEKFWDDDRRSEVEAVGARLASAPAATVRALEKTPHGCDWMIRRWALLARVADLDGEWTEGQKSLAFDLLATPEDFRLGMPGQTVDAHGRAIGEVGGDLAVIARGQVDRLMAVREAVKDADALDRAMAMADMSDASSPELRRLRRYEATLHKRMRWNLHQIQQVPRWATPHPSLNYLFESEPEVPPATVADAPPPAAEPEPEVVADTEADEVETTAVVAPARSSRPDPVKARAQARHRAKRDKVERDGS